jgi:AcrR family transcriptional regulator
MKEQDTRTRILQVASNLFQERSFKKVSVDEIAKTAGVSKGGLFHHFPSKYILGRDALLWWANEHMGEAMSEDFLSLEPREQIRHFIDMSVHIVDSEVNFGKYVIEMYEEALEREEELDIWLNFLTQYVDVIEGIFAQMGAKDPRMKAMIMFCSIDGFAMYYTMLQATGKKIDMDDFRTELYRLYLGDD